MLDVLGRTLRARLRRPRGSGAVVLYDASLFIIALLVALVGLVALTAQQHSAQSERRIVVVQPGPEPPGHARIPPGQLKKRSYVRVVTMTPSVAHRYKLRYQQGVLVTEVVAVDGPGMTLLLHQWDVIVAVNGDPVTTEAQLRALLKRADDDDDWVKLTVWRAGRMVTVLVPVEAFEFDD